jgi:Sec1 family
VFTFSRKNILPAFKLIDEGQGIDSPHLQKMLEELSNRLFTVCSVFMEHPYILYQGKSPMAKTLAQKLNESLAKFYSNSANGKIKKREPRGQLIILDRAFDLLTPVLHDYFY